MYLGGYDGDLSLIGNMTRVHTGFSGCVRRFHVNGRLMDMRKARHIGDALYGIDVRTSLCQGRRSRGGLGWLSPHF